MSDICWCGLLGHVDEDWNLIWCNGRCMIGLRMLYEGLLIVELRAILTHKAAPICHAAVVPEHVLFPSFLRIEKDVRLIATGQDTSVST